MPPVISIRENGVMKMIRPITYPLAGLIRNGTSHQMP
jgi:hypothetical protein